MNISRTSTEVAEIAGRGLKAPASLSAADIRAVCASALAQADDTASPATPWIDVPSVLLGAVVGALVTLGSILAMAKAIVG